MGGQDTRWKVLEGAWVVGTHGSEFRCCTECNSPKFQSNRDYRGIPEYTREDGED